MVGVPDLAGAILALVPAATFGGTAGGSTITLVDDGNGPISQGQGPQIAYWPLALGVEPTQAALQAVTPAEVAAAYAAQPRAKAQALFAQAGTPLTMLLRAIVLATVDEFNVLLAKAGLAKITAAQVRQAIASHITAGDADNGL